MEELWVKYGLTMAYMEYLTIAVELSSGII